MSFNIFRGLLPINPRRAARDALAGLTLASMNIPQVLGYTRIAGTPIVTGLYTVLLLPTAIVNTMLASTLCGRYRRGPVRNTSTTSTTAEKHELGELTSCARFVSHGRLGRTAIYDKRPAERRGGVGGRYPQDVRVFVNPLLVHRGIRNGRDHRRRRGAELWCTETSLETLFSRRSAGP
jgi:hypothetical protein